MQKALIFILALLAGCTAQGTVGSQATPDEQRIGAWAATHFCSLSYERSGTHQSSQQIANVVVNSLTPGEGGWVSADVSSNGIRSNIYINNRTGIVICGSRALDKAQVTFRPSRTPPASWLHDTEEALQVLNLGGPIR